MAELVILGAGTPTPTPSRWGSAFAARDGGRETVQERGLAGLGRSGDHDVETGFHGRAEEPARLLGHAAEADQVLQGCGADHELADVHRTEAA